MTLIRNESGGARAATAADFFQRFPSLFLFLLTELGNITGYSIHCHNAWPEQVVSSSSIATVETPGKHTIDDCL